MDGGGDDEDDGFVGSLWKVMGLKEKRVFAGLMKKVELFLLKRESGDLVVNNLNEHEKRELVDIIVAGMRIAFAAVGCEIEKEKGIVLGFFPGLNGWTAQTKSNHTQAQLLGSSFSPTNQN